jgi:hypothetical protein
MNESQQLHVWLNWDRSQNKAKSFTDVMRDSVAFYTFQIGAGEIQYGARSDSSTAKQDFEMMLSIFRTNPEWDAEKEAQFFESVPYFDYSVEQNER